VPDRAHLGPARSSPGREVADPAAGAAQKDSPACAGGRQDCNDPVQPLRHRVPGISGRGRGGEFPPRPIGDSRDVCRRKRQHRQKSIVTVPVPSGAPLAPGTLRTISFRARIPAMSFKRSCAFPAREIGERGVTSGPAESRPSAPVPVARHPEQARHRVYYCCNGPVFGRKRVFLSNGSSDWSPEQTNRRNGKNAGHPSTVVAAG